LSQTLTYVGANLCART